MGGAMGAGSPQGPNPLMMQALGVGQGVPMSFGDFGQEQMKAMMRKLQTANPVNPTGIGMPPGINQLNKMMLQSYGQNSPLQSPSPLQPPAARSNTSPYGV